MIDILDVHIPQQSLVVHAYSTLQRMIDSAKTKGLNYWNYRTYK